MNEVTIDYLGYWTVSSIEFGDLLTKLFPTGDSLRLFWRRNSESKDAAAGREIEHYPIKSARIQR
jgi:hypothetical protein